MTAKKNQHYVPKSYLAAWCDPEIPEGHEPYVHLFLRDGSGHKQKSPHNIFAMTDLYTSFGIDGNRDLTVEDAFSTLEGKFVSVRNGLLDGNDLTADDLSVLFTFTGAMMVRVPPQIEHMRRFWHRLYTIAADVRIVPGSKPLPIINPSSKQALSLADVTETVRNPMGTWFPEAVKAHVDGLLEYFTVTILLNETDTPFVTSDNPAVRFDTLHERRETIFRGGLSSPGMEVTLPASPRMALLFQHGSGYLLGYRYADANDVADINMRTIAFAEERFVTDRADPSFVQAVTELIRQKPGVK